MRTSIATVCLSGTLTDKLRAAAEAGFDGVEIFEPDLVASPASPEEIVALADRLGLSLDLYQPFRDAEGVTEDEFERVLRRARAKFVLMQRLGIETMLVCSNVGTATIDDDAVSAGQLRRLGEAAAEHGVRIAFEALAWGRYVDDYRRAWRIVELADHDAVGVCLDSFHILSRGHDPAAIEEIPGRKVFFLQLADAPALSMDVLSWSRHHRLFPGEGAFDLGSFLTHVLRTGYDGPLSLEVFNDVFRQTEVGRTARQARRSLTWLEDLVGSRPLPPVAEPTGFDFVEVRAEDTGEVDVLLGQLGLTFRGRHRSKDARLWADGPARIVCNEQHARDRAPSLAAVGFQVADPAVSAARARALQAPTVYRRTLATEQELPAFRAPDGTEVFLGSDSGSEATWTPEFEGGRTTGHRSPDRDRPRQPGRAVAVLRRGGPLLQQRPGAARGRQPGGALTPRAGAQPGRAVGLRRLPARPQRRTADVGRVLGLPAARGVLDRRRRRRRQAGGRARPGAAGDPAELLRRPRRPVRPLRGRGPGDGELGLLHDRDGAGTFTHFYTATVGEVFFEVVQRVDGYDGYGAPNAGVRLAAQAPDR